MELCKCQNKTWLGLTKWKERKPFSDINDPIFEKMLKLPEQLKHMNVSESTYKTGAMCLTSDTNNALNVTLIGLVSLVKLLLNHGFSYILPENM